jgi:hypothetical protein
LSEEKEIVAIEKDDVIVFDGTRIDVVQHRVERITLAESTAIEIVGVEDKSAVAVLEESRQIIIAGGDQGPQGIQGLPGQAGVSYFTFTASGAIGGHRAVVISSAGAVGYADNTLPDHANAVVGITLGAAADGDDIQVQDSGEITEPSWNWMLQQPVFLSTNGLLTQTCPTSGFVLVIGTPTASDTLLVSIKQPFLLEG